MRIKLISLFKIPVRVFDKTMGIMAMNKTEKPDYPVYGFSGFLLIQTIKNQEIH